ncbi:hypothetical protein ACSLOP_30580, partial [Escherichia coli]
MIPPHWRFYWLRRHKNRDPEPAVLTNQWRRCESLRKTITSFESPLMKKILLITGDFSEDYEVMVPWQALNML